MTTDLWSVALGIAIGLVPVAWWLAVYRQDERRRARIESAIMQESADARARYLRDVAWTFQCSDCGEVVSWNEGGADDERCDACWCVAHEEVQS